MDYKQRLIFAAKCVYDGESRAAEEARVDHSDYGIQATLKPHQVEGVSWLIRRYHLGVNVILGIVNLYLFRFPFGKFKIILYWNFGEVLLRLDSIPVCACVISPSF